MERSLLKWLSCVAACILLRAIECVTHADLTLVDTWPKGGEVCVDAPLRLTFNQPPVLGAGKIEVCRQSGAQVVDTVEIAAGRERSAGILPASSGEAAGTLTGDKSLPRYEAVGSSELQLRYAPVTVSRNTASIRLRPGALVPGEEYFVRVASGAFTDAEAHDFPGLADGWKFRVRSTVPVNAGRLIVAADGSGDFCTVQGAVDHIQPHRTHPALIFIRKGRYEELVRIGKDQPHIRLLGEERDGTLIAFTNNEKLNSGWIQRSVLGVEGDDFSLENLTVQNTTPYKGSQAEAVYINAGRCALQNARFLSLQDTLHLSGRVYVADSLIEGDVDYLWGYGSACFDRCELRSMHDGYYVQARNAPDQTGYVFTDCKLTAAPEVKKCWLARIETARFPASHVAFIRCQMGRHILPAGWQTTGPAEAALRFEEYQSTDPTGALLDVTQRDPAGKQITAERAAEESDPAKVLAGKDGWNPKALTEPALRIAIIGDSTVCEYPSENPARGWGHYIQDAFKEDVQVMNLAASGRSTKTFIAERRWQRTLELKPRFILIQFGHNDSHDPSHAEATDAATTYKEFLRRYIDEARAIGATPILVTPMCRRTFNGPKLQDALLPYSEAMKEAAAEKKAPVIDLHTASRDYFEKLGETASLETANKPGDQTHFNEKGAKAMAALVVKELPTADAIFREHLK